MSAGESLAESREGGQELTFVSPFLRFCRSSSLRKKADQHKETLEDDIKYGGERRSRKQIFDDDNEDDDDDDLSDDGEEGAQDDEDENMEVPDRDEEEEEESSSDDGGQPHASTSSTQLQEVPSLETTQILSSIRQSRSEDLAKGLGVKRQLELFEKVMPLRIRLQKAVVGIEEVKVSPPTLLSLPAFA